MLDLSVMILRLKKNLILNNPQKIYLITSQLRTALVLSRDIKSTNYQIDTYKQKIYLYGIAMSNDEKDLVLKGAKF